MYHRMGHSTPATGEDTQRNANIYGVIDLGRRKAVKTQKQLPVAGADDQVWYNDLLVGRDE
jgi:hypothetical protein